MPEAILSDYFYGDESEQFVFFKIPRQLITDPKFKYISTDAKRAFPRPTYGRPPPWSGRRGGWSRRRCSGLRQNHHHANLKYKYGNRQFWCKGYYVDTVGRNKKAIAEYIRNQLAEDKLTDQLTIKEYYDPFTGEPANKSK